MSTPSRAQDAAAPPAGVLDVRGLAYAYPDGHQALYGVDLQVRRSAVHRRVRVEVELVTVRRAHVRPGCLPGHGSCAAAGR